MCVRPRSRFARATPRRLTVNLPDERGPLASPTKPTFSSFVLVFPLLPKPTSCVRSVDMQLRVLDGQGGEGGTLAAYASKLLSLADGELGRVRSNGVYVGIRPRGIADVPPDPGWFSFDVTDLYKLWADGGPFPNGETVPHGTPLVVEVRPPSYTPASSGRDAAFVRHFAAVAAGRGSAPRLRWTALRNC